MQAAEHNARLELAQAALQQAILLDKNGRLQGARALETSAMCWIRCAKARFVTLLCVAFVVLEAFDAYSTALDAFFEIGR